MSPLSNIRTDEFGGELENRIKFYKSSVDNFFKGKYDLIISNHPYINKFYLKYLEIDLIGFEPNLALEGGIDGFSILELSLIHI